MRKSASEFLIDIAETGRYNNFLKAGVAQLVEYKLPKLGVAGSRPVARSIFPFY
jgi:hypothetical protein